MSKKKNKHKSSFLTDPLSRRQFKKELRSATRSQFRPLNRELQKQGRINKLQAQNTSRWFNAYQQQIGRMKQDSAAGYASAGQAMNNYAAAAGSRNAALMNELNSQNAQNAQLYGQQPNQTAANYALQSGAMNAQMGGDMAGAIQAQGANTNAYFGGLKANSKLGRIEALSALRANRQQISQDKQDLIRERADFRNQYLSDAREGERRYALALKELRNANRQAAKDRKFQSSEAAKDRRNSNRQAAKDRKQSKWENKHGGSSSSDGGGKERKDAIAALRSAPLNFDKIFSKNSKSASVGIIAEYLRNEASVSASLARKLAKQYVAKHWTQSAVGGAIGGAGGHAGGKGNK